MELSGKVALVTGAGSGIGRASALLLAREGAKVAALSRTESEVQSLADEIRKAGGEAIAIRADISSAEDMERAYREVADKWGRLDIVHANAGINGVWAPIEELTAEEWDRTINNNLRGTFLTIKYAVPLLKKRGGSVIVTSSVNGTRTFSLTGGTAYSVSKGGQVVMVKMLAVELARHKIRINAVCPGAVESEIDQNTERRNLESIEEQIEYKHGAMIPLTRGKPAGPDAIANVVLFLASDASSFISGTEVWADGVTSLVRG
jgi:NAD(P)-dependent dehydrogenase (short-subunit alcohol dehydrogenase family)